MSRVSAAGLETAVLRAGPQDAPPLLLLHGGGIDRAAMAWAETLPRLAPARRLIAPDLPGYGDSAGFAGPHDLADLGRWALALMDALGLERADVLGNSMGGAIALWLALEAPARVGRVVAVGSYGLARRNLLQPLVWLHVRLNGSRATARACARSAAAARLAVRALYADPRRLDPAMIPPFRAEAAAQARRGAFRDFLKGEVTPARFRSCLLDRLPGMTRPVLYVHGTKDRLVPVGHARRAARLTPGAALWTPRAGHWPMREIPEDFAARVAEFLA